AQADSAGGSVEGRAGCAGRELHLPRSGQGTDEEVAEIVWSNSALDELDDIAEYVALDKPEAARELVERVFSSVDRLQRFPASGRIPAELPNSVYRELLVAPCRFFYRTDKGIVLIIHVMREERLLRKW